MFARRHLVPGSSRAAALLVDRLADRPRLAVLNLASLASSLVGVAALAVGGLVTVALVF
jgi:hypothetical protein